MGYRTFLFSIEKVLISSDFPSKGVQKSSMLGFFYFTEGALLIFAMHDRSIIASITDRNITSDLAIRTLQKALASQPKIKGELILHSDQGSQFTSKAFVEFCESAHVTQSMSKAGYPYDNAPMERYFNTLKNECINLYEFNTEDALYRAVEEFAYVEYNYVRPHSYNGYATPHAARFCS